MDDGLLDKGDSLFPLDDMAPLICEVTNVFTYDNPGNAVNNTECGEGSKQ